MERMCLGWGSRDVSFPRWRGDSKSSPPQVDWGLFGNRSGQEPTKPERQLHEELQTTRDSEQACRCGCAQAPTVRCKETELCPVGAGRWPRGHWLKSAGSCEPVPGETLVNDPLKGGVPGSAAVPSQPAICLLACPTKVPGVALVCYRLSFPVELSYLGEGIPKSHCCIFLLWVRAMRTLGQTAFLYHPHLPRPVPLKAPALKLT